MPKILITGNGFDLGLGLPTAYSDFINILNKVEEDNTALDFESIYANTTGCSELIKNFKPFAIAQEPIVQFREQLKDNLWYQFFKEETQLETWIDFENKIEYVLKILFYSVEQIRANVFENQSVDVRHTLEIDLFHKKVEIIEILTKFKLVSRGNHYRVILNENYLIKKYYHFIGLDIAKFSEFLYAELMSFKKIFNCFFELFILPLYDNLKIKIDKVPFSKFDRHYTFNYTPTYEKIYKKSETHFIHGKVNSIENKIVLGISDISDENVDRKFFIPFTKYFQKLNNHTDFVFLREFEKKTNQNFMFFFWGHSLDVSDADYINEVFEFVGKLTFKIKKIVVIYHTEEAKSKLLTNLLHIRGKNDIQGLMRGGHLIFCQTNSPELKNELNRVIATSSATWSI